jgi:hypothetical protein
MNARGKGGSMSPKQIEGVIRARLVAAVVIGVVLASVVSITPAHAAQPARSGTILVAARAGVIWTTVVPGCHGSPECRAWLMACTEAPSEELGATYSFVDVRKLAGSSKPRTFAVVDRVYTSLNHYRLPIVTVEFWGRSCDRVPFDDGRTLRDVWSQSTFKIPRYAAWMTVTPACTWICVDFSGAAVRWELR